MQTIGQYRLIQALGTCPVGAVWSAIDAADNHATVAVLNASAAHDPGWRNAFAATANSLAQSGQISLVTGDYSGAIPWIASAARDGVVLGQVFSALGLDYRLVAATEPSTPAGPVPAAQPQASTSSPPQPVPDTSQPAEAATPPSHPIPPQPTAEPAMRSHGGQPVDSLYTVSPYSAPPAAPPPRRPIGALIGVLVLVLAVLLGGGTALAVALWPSDEPEVEATGTPTSAAADTPAPAPSQPGIEPPEDGEWPTDWPMFGETEPVTPMPDLAGLGFAFDVPEGWDCTSVTVNERAAHYTCGEAGNHDGIGGDLLVRQCPDPCDAERRVDLRTAEEAWGVQWVRDGFYRCWGETLQVAGEERYGLAIVGYWRTTDEGRLDRQLVVRMSAPVDQADGVRKVAGSIREGIL